MNKRRVFDLADAMARQAELLKGTELERHARSLVERAVELVAAGAAPAPELVPIRVDRPADRYRRQR